MPDKKTFFYLYPNKFLHNWINILIFTQNLVKYLSQSKWSSSELDWRPPCLVLYSKLYILPVAEYQAETL